MNLVNLTENDLVIIREELLKHGVILFRNQSMTRKQQIDFTERIGTLIPLPTFLNLKDPEIGFESKILRVTNYDSKGLPKKQKELNGQYWHKDGNYMQNDYIGSMLYADEIDEFNGDSRPTLFLDNCLMDVYPKALLDQVNHLANEINIGTIKDFTVTEDDMKQHPPVFPKVISKHPQNGKDCLYLTEFLTLNGNLTQKEQEIIEQLWDIIIKEAPKYSHHWREGDVVIWDNLAVMHRTGPVTKQSIIGKRMMYRTTYFI
ncbi:alpha-ketoglutarate-dependent taurine dioxygenase-like [Clytia hemisphaerica]|uniref:TauD/TfdA-like domain-containing protein n=1 Tax=Clytia hemisphaerica TaxID=252671 RepID=A0A7M5V8J7_9CNID